LTFDEDVQKTERTICLAPSKNKNTLNTWDSINLSNNCMLIRWRIAS